MTLEEINLNLIWPGLEERSLKEERLSRGEELAAYCYYAAGGRADYFIAPENLPECLAALRWAREAGIELTVLGLASNVLGADEGISGLVLSTQKLVGMRRWGPYIVVEAGRYLADFVAGLVDEECCAYSQLVGIPGTLGGALFMNAGAYEQEISTYLDMILLYNPESGDVSLHKKEEGDFGYRHSFLQETGEIVLAAFFRLPSYPNSQALQEMAEVQLKRRSAQPLFLPRCGSAFKRPPGHYVGKLISDLGWKGRRRGQVGVSMKHAGFIVNHGGASAREIRDFYKAVQQAVQEAYDVHLEPEVRWLGRWPEGAEDESQ